jgi:hypothetical protein
MRYHQYKAKSNILKGGFFMKNKLLSAIMAFGVLSTSIIAPMNVCAVSSDATSVSAVSENESNTTTYPVATTIVTTTTVAETSEQEVNNSLYGFSVAPSELSLSVGDTYQLNVTFEGNNYYENSVVFSSSNSRIVGVTSEGIVTAREEGATTLKISAKVNDENIKLDENESIVKTLYVKVNVSPDKSLTAEQNELLSQLKEKGNRLIGEFQRKEKEIRGEFAENSPRVTMNDIESIISESDTYREITSKLQMIQKYPDFIGGSGVTIVEYWFDDYGYQKLLLILEQEDVIYVKCNNSGKIIDWNLLSPVEKDISFESYQVKMIGSFNVYNDIADNLNTNADTNSNSHTLIQKGDANCDNELSMADAVLIMQSIANPAKFGIEGTDENHITEQGKKNADIAGENDGITNADALAIQKKLLKLD